MDPYTTNEANEVQEGLNVELEELKVDLSDDQIIGITNKYVARSKESRATLDKMYDENRLYYLGKQLGKNKQVVDNRIFTSVETIVPIATASEPVPNVLPYQDTVESIKLARNWEKILMADYKHQKIQKKTEKVVRHLSIARYGVFKYYYDVDKDCVDTRVIHPKRILFDNDCDIDDGLEWIGEKVSVTAEELAAMFPEKEKEITKEVKGKMGSTVTYLEFWTDDLFIARYNKIVLRKSKNPNFDYENSKNNYFEKPCKPYIFINLFDLGEELSGATSLIEQAAPLQDGINKRKTQIDRNASIVNGKVIGTGANGMKKSEFANIDWNNSEEGIWMSDGEIGDIKRESGSPLPSFVENDMYHSQGEIDNIMGTHSTTRGERTGRETATGRQILRESDRGRIDMIGRRLEESLVLLFKGWCQIIKVFYTKKRIIRVLGEDKTTEFLEMDRNDINEGMEIEIINGTLIPEDRASRRERALLLANAQLIDPITLYRELGFRNPEDMAMRLYKWQTDPVSLFEELKREQESSVEGSVEQKILKAKDENSRMLQGEPQPPFEGADGNHLAVHQQLMEQPDFRNLKPAVQKAFVEHVRAEAEQVQGAAKDTL